MEDELVEVVDGVLVEVEEPRERTLVWQSPPVQTAMAAAAGIAAGAATFALLRRHSRRLEAAERDRAPVRLSGTYVVTIRPLR